MRAHPGAAGKARGGKTHARSRARTGARGGVAYAAKHAREQAGGYRSAKAAEHSGAALHARREEQRAGDAGADARKSSRSCTQQQ